MTPIPPSPIVSIRRYSSMSRSDDSPRGGVVVSEPVVTDGSGGCDSCGSDESDGALLTRTPRRFREWSDGQCPAPRPAAIAEANRDSNFFAGQNEANLHRRQDASRRGYAVRAPPVLEGLAGSPKRNRHRLGRRPGQSLQ